jgi:hypothetical protein
MHFALAKFAVASLILVGLAQAQITPEPPATAMVSSPAGNKASDNTENKASDSTKSTEDSMIEPGQPAEPSVTADPTSLIPDLKPVPVAKPTLIGGTIEKLDRVRDQITLNVFGGGHAKILFDPRTRIYEGATETTAANLREGERVYLDTILDGSTVFARSIRLKTTVAMGESQGVVLKYRPDRGELTVRDAISPTPVRVRVDSSTRLLKDGRAVTTAALQSDSLIAIKFSSEGSGHDLAREISILALPGTRYTFVGLLVHIDLRTGLLVINSSTDHKTYEVYLDPCVTPDDNLHPGAMVTVVTNFEGSRYVARNLTIDAQGK